MPPDVYTAQDIAAAARVPEGLVTTLVARGEIRSVAALLPAGQPVPSSLVIPAGAAIASVTITPINDTTIEPDETVILTITPSSAYTLGAAASATVTIVSDDRAVDLVIGAVTPPATAAAGGTIQVTDTTIEDMLEDCATDDEHYYNATNNQALLDAFAEIGGFLSELRLAE